MRGKFGKAQRSQGGQGLTEYAMVIAFVGILIALAFGITRGSLFAAISDSYSSANNSLGQLNTAANNTGNNPL